MDRSNMVPYRIWLNVLPIRQPVFVLCANPTTAVDLALHLSIFTGSGCTIFFLAAIWHVLQLASSISGSGTL